jgi:hypothetical protein
MDIRTAILAALISRANLLATWFSKFQTETLPALAFERWCRLRQDEILFHRGFKRGHLLIDLGVFADDEEAGQQKHQRNRDQTSKVRRLRRRHRIPYPTAASTRQTPAISRRKP